MQSFTFGSDEGMSALVKAMEADVTDDPFGDGHKSRHLHTKHYPMELNPRDFEAVVFALRAYSEGACDGEATGDCDVIECRHPDHVRRETAGELLSGMAETLGIEFV